MGFDLFPKSFRGLIPGGDPSVPKEPTPQEAETELAMNDQEIADSVDRQQQIMAETSMANPYTEPQYEEAPPRTVLEQQAQIVKPSPYDSDYHKWLSKETPLSNLDSDEVPILDVYTRLINMFTYYGQKDLANIYHMEKLERLRTTDGLGGFQQRVWQSRIVSISRTAPTANQFTPGQQPQTPL